MSGEVAPLVEVVLQSVSRRLLLKSAGELFRTVVAAQPPPNKRREADDDQLDAFASDLRDCVTELTPRDIAELRSAAVPPSLAQLDALRVLLDMKPRDVLDHPGPRLELPVADPAGVIAWGTVMDLSNYRRQGWTLVGGQMVHLLAWEHGEESPRVTTDVDVVINVRAYPNALTEVTDRLLSAGYEEDGVSPEGMGHRYRHKSVPAVSIDVLLPEGLGDHAYRTITGARTIEVPGSVQALERSLRRNVRLNGTDGAIIRPDVHAAMVLKAAAYQDERGTVEAQRHLRDFAVLVSLYARHYPALELRERLTAKDCRRLANALGHALPTDPLWRTVADGLEARDLIASSVEGR